MRNTRPISWIKAARRNFENLRDVVQGDMLGALTIAADGGKSDKTKPFKGVEDGATMKDDFELVHGSGNVFLDFGRPNASVEQTRAILATEIIRALDKKNFQLVKLRR